MNLTVCLRKKSRKKAKRCMKQATSNWLNFAKADILNCEKIIDEEFLTNIVAFHSQQAVEKSFKALKYDKLVKKG